MDRIPQQHSARRHQTLQEEGPTSERWVTPPCQHLRTHRGAVGRQASKEMDAVSHRELSSAHKGQFAH